MTLPRGRRKPASLVEAEEGRERLEPPRRPEAADGIVTTDARSQEAPIKLGMNERS